MKNLLLPTLLFTFFINFAAVNYKKMEKQDDLTLLKPRGYRRVLSAGFRLYTGNFRRLFKASWQMTLLYALSCGTLGTLTAIKIPELSLALQKQLIANHGIMPETLREYLLTLLGIPALMLLALATLALASAPILSKLKEHKETGTITTPPHWLTASPHLMGRSLKGVFLTVLVMLIPFVVFAALLLLTDMIKPQFVVRHWMTTLVALMLYTIVIVQFYLPLYHVVMKYVMEVPCGYWRTLGRNYGVALRHWGMLFLVFFISGLFILLVSLVVMLPANILSFANQQAHNGLLMGDALGMPSYIVPLTFAITTLCSFIHFYISQVILVHNYYVYGSIETHEKERTESQSLNAQQ